MTKGEGEVRVWKRFGALVRRWREERGMTLREVAKHAARRTRGRGLSVSYLSDIERGTTAPPRTRVLSVLAEILDIPFNKLELTAQGWIVLDPVEVLEPFPEYQELVKKIRAREEWDVEEIFGAMLDVAPRRAPDADKGRRIRVTFGDDIAEMLFLYRPKDG